MPGFRNRSQNALPVWLADDDGNPVSAGGGSASGPQPATGSQSVTPATDGGAFPVAGIVVSGAMPTPAAGTKATLVVDGRNNLRVVPGTIYAAPTSFALGGYTAFPGATTADMSPSQTGALAVGGYVWNTATNAAVPAPGDGNGAFVVGKGGANIATGQVSIPANTATLVVAARTGRQKVTLSPTTSAAFYQGGSAVSATNGLFLPAGSAKTTDTAAAVYVFSTTAITMSFEELF